MYYEINPSCSLFNMLSHPSISSIRPHQQLVNRATAFTANNAYPGPLV